MELMVLNENFEAMSVVDTFESLIWTERYSQCGDFEIYTFVDPTNLITLQEDFYLVMNESETVMIIDTRRIANDIESGNRLIITGNSLEYILHRRIIWTQTILTGNFQNGIHQLLNENIIDPVIPSRKINNFIFEASTDPVITALTVDTQFTGDNLYDAIVALCESNNIGFRITLTDDNKFKFKLYSGANRSYDQLTNPYVVFSPKFENILNSNYIESKAPLRTITLVAGEGEGADRRVTTVEAPSGGGSGLSRREMFTDANDVSSTIDGGTLSDPEYIAQLAQRGKEALAENVFVTSFEGQVDATHLYKYGEHFFIGDIVQIANEYGIEAKARVIELIRSQSLEGTDVYPTFMMVE